MSRDQTLGTFNPAVGDSLSVLTGRRDMQLLEYDDPVAGQLARGRNCHNCSGMPYRFIVVPMRREIVLICGDCIWGFAGVQEGATADEVDMAVNSLGRILQDTREDA